MRKLLKKILDPALKKLFFAYHASSKTYTYKNISVIVHPEVFPPHFTISTKILLDFLASKNLKNQTLLELGCGSGIISLFSASKGAKVTASDINQIALENLEETSKKNTLPIEILFSDLFQNIPQTSFDFIIINPPYYPKAPKDTKEKAWYCGENFEYFEQLFQQLATEISFKNTYMILSEDCHLLRIQKIASKHALEFTCILKKQVYFEKNFIFKITKTPAIT